MNLTTYVQRWLKGAYRTLKKDPASDLRNYTYINYGAYGSWDTGISKVYFQPTSAEERNLRDQIYRVLLIAFQNVVRRAEQLSPQKWDDKVCLDASEAYRLALMIGMVDPVFAVQAKVRLNNLYEKFEESVERMTNETPVANEEPFFMTRPVTKEW